MIDGRFDVQSLMTMATLREHAVLQTLERMLERGAIALRETDPAHERELRSGLTSRLWMPRIVECA